MKSVQVFLADLNLSAISILCGLLIGMFGLPVGWLMLAAIAEPEVALSALMRTPANAVVLVFSCLILICAFYVKRRVGPLHVELRGLMCKSQGTWFGELADLRPVGLAAEILYCKTESVGISPTR